MLSLNKLLSFFVQLSPFNVIEEPRRMMGLPPILF
nr:MAG TPA: hypothetical protein [Caudoviricetes sp.]